MSSQPLSFDQARQLLDTLGPSNSFRVVTIICQQPAMCSRLLAAWQKQAAMHIIRLSAQMQAIQVGKAGDYQLMAIQELNRIAESKDHLALVLEDIDQFEDRVVQSFADWLVNYLPPNLTVVLVGAQPPQLSLSRLRVRRMLLEIELRAA